MSGSTKLPPIHPGEILREEFLEPFGLSASALARHIEVPTNRVTEILNAERSVSADTAMRLSRAFNTTPEFWMNLQALYELETVGKADVRKIDDIEPIRIRAYA